MKNVTTKISDYTSMVKFSHTVFALPFAMIGYVYAITLCGYSFELGTIIKVLLCMLFARNTAMGFNRWADRKIDAANQRTAGREIPVGKISPKAAIWFVLINALSFIIAASFINTLTAILAPVALLIVMGYSYAKRFTMLSHMILGLALGIAPVGAFVAVTGTFDIVPMMLAMLVMTWVGGFDILYSLQDAEFDRAHGLYSMPSRFGIKGALIISGIVHVMTVWLTLLIGYYLDAEIFYWVGTAIFIALTILQHILITPLHIDRVGAMFGIVNGLSSVVYATFFIIFLITS